MNYRPAQLEVLLPLFLLCLLAEPAAAGPGYLSVTGPVPLRLRKAMPPSAEVQLPALRPLVIPVASIDVAPTNMSIPMPAQTPTAGPANPVPLAPDVDYAAGPPPPSEAAAPPPGVPPYTGPGPLQLSPPAETSIDPMALLNYYLSVATNGMGPRVVMPVFIPPPPPAPSPVSRATYESR